VTSTLIVSVRTTHELLENDGIKAGLLSIDTMVNLTPKNSNATLPQSDAIGFCWGAETTRLTGKTGH
jgi:hypothetical protein